MITAVVLTIFFIGKELQMSFSGMVRSIAESDYSRVFVWNDWRSSQHFVKQFLSGAFITIVMTGLDQDMMQKNLSCRNLKDARKNVLSYGIAFLPVNLLFLSLGVLLVTFIQQKGIEMPARADDLYPLIATGGFLPGAVGLFFFLGLMAAAFSSADSALTSLTTSLSVDIININRFSPRKSMRIRVLVHLGFAIVLGLVIIVFRLLQSDSIISAIYTLVGYTYGPLLGLYAFGLFTRRKVRDRLVPWISVLSPLVIGLLDYNALAWFGFQLGFEKLMLNGVFTFLALRLTSPGKIMR
jgi:Na+/proline symporter